MRNLAAGMCLWLQGWLPIRWKHADKHAPSLKHNPSPQVSGPLWLLMESIAAGMCLRRQGC